MLTGAKILGKLEQILPHYRALRFEKIAEVHVEMQQTCEMLPGEPAGGAWRKMTRGDRWGDSWITGWFCGDVTVPAELVGRRVFLRARTGGMEALLLVDGECKGTFTEVHPLVAMAHTAAAKTYRVALEAYSGHSYPGAQPNETPIVVGENSRVFEGVTLEVEREDVSAFVFDLDLLMNLVKMLDVNSLRKNTIARELACVWETIRAFPEECAETEWRPALATARKIMAPLLAAKNGPTTPTIALVAHSHIDTAWLWPIAETRRKTGRTFSSMLNLMEQYPEVIFLQSAPCHAEMAKEDYPQVFARMKKLIAEGRWEPNGGAWVEPDCNLTGGEALVRQFLVGINWTREHYGYSPDAFWQPDVFGYSAALPQILKGFNIDYFLTTKMAWNDTTRFPYDTFTWRGINGSTVLTHLNSLPQFINAHNVVEMWNWSQHKDSEDKRLASYGYGDGGGGPTAEDMELVRRLADVEGAPRTEYTTVSRFMKELNDAGRRWPEWVGELYLELHRGTLTSIAGIKRGNRKSEIALRDAEFVSTLAALRGREYPAANMLELWKDLLINQFHDILPGTSIARVNDEAIAAFAQLQIECSECIYEALKHISPASPVSSSVMLLNTLSWDRGGEIAIPLLGKSFTGVDGAVAQRITDLSGAEYLITDGVTIPAFGSIVVAFDDGQRDSPSPFRYNDGVLKTPHGAIKFEKNGTIGSFRLVRADREVVMPGGALNGFLSGEDVPLAWDNWDIDSDQESRMKLEARLITQEVVADGPLQFRILQEYEIGRASRLRQHVIFYAGSPRITFETAVDWNEKHTLLKVGFDLNILCESARHEIQFGHVERPTHRNYPQDRARFEVCAHKWTDLSDNGFGVALLNDCKYGVGVSGSSIQLSLLKSGTHPDPRGDNGIHQFTYEILPHEGPFSVPSVVRPAYELNIPIICRAVPSTAEPLKSLLTIDQPNIIVEAIKWAEDGTGFIVRLYEAGRISSMVALTVNHPVSGVVETDLLEEKKRSHAINDGRIQFRMEPFEIKTLKFISKM